MRKGASALFLGLLVVLAGCAAPPTHEHELRIALALDPTSLSPITAFAQDQIALDLLWCQTLVGLDARNRISPVLVTRVPSRTNGDVSPDGLRITYHLRRDARFADGVPFTSADVVFTYRAILEPANLAPTIDQYRRIASVTAPDAHTVVIRLREPWGAAVNVLFAQADEAYGILPKHAFTGLTIAGSDWAQQPFGTGPFRVAAWHRGDRIELEPNPYFAPRPKLARIIMRIVPDQTTAFNALRTHAVDVTQLNPDNVERAERSAGVRIVRTPENGLQAIYFQTAAAPTNDVRVRRAVAAAIDYAALTSAWRGLYPPLHTIYPPAVVSWAAGPPAFVHDPAAARRELDAAGWHLNGRTRVKNGMPLSLLVITDATRPILGRIAVVLQSQLAKAGLDVTIKAYTSALLAAEDGPQRGGRFSLSIGGLIGGSDPEQSLNVLCAQATGDGENYMRYCSPRVEALFRRQMTATNERARTAALAAIAAVVRADVPLIPLYADVTIEGVDERVTGYARNMLRYPVHPEDWDTKMFSASGETTR